MELRGLRGWAGRDHARRPAVVLGVSVTALSYLRSLSRQGVPTLLLDGAESVGRRSRFGVTVCMPHVEEQPDVWLEALLSTADRLQRRPVLLPAYDQAVVLVASHAEQLASGYDFLLPPLPTVAGIVDKRRQYDLARSAGIPTPWTRFPESGDEAVALAAEVSYPCLLKPYVPADAAGHIAGKAVLVGGAETLRREFDRLAAVGVRCMLQEVVPGGDDALYGYLSFWGRDGRELAWITKQKLRQYPARFGDGTYQRTVDVPRVAELSRRFLSALGYVGVGSTEFKYDARDDSYRLIELNPRAVSGNELAVAAGVDLPYISYRYLVDGAVPDWEQLWNVYWVHELLDLKTLLRECENRRRAVRTWMQGLRRADAFAVAARDDPGPLLGTFAQRAFKRSANALRAR
jgi:predicted ATP-grasp superfamily ATP-dependent carboligase